MKKGEGKGGRGGDKYEGGEATKCQLASKSDIGLV
jgi:hypothetical protein